MKFAFIRILVSSHVVLTTSAYAYMAMEWVILFGNWLAPHWRLAMGFADYPMIPIILVLPVFGTVLHFFADRNNWPGASRLWHSTIAAWLLIAILTFMPAVQG